MSGFPALKKRQRGNHFLGDQRDDPFFPESVYMRNPGAIPADIINTYNPTTY
jgi:hypothetical protein